MGELMERLRMQLKRWMALLLVVFLLGGMTVAFSGCQKADGTEDDEAPALPDRISLGLGTDPVTVLSGERFDLALDPATMGVVLTDKVRQTTWRSNPEGATAVQKAQFSLSFVDGHGNFSQMESYTDCVERYQASVHRSEDGNSVYVQYMLGNYEMTSDILPQSINSTKFQTRILDQLDEADAEEMLGYYKYYETDDASLGTIFR